MSCLLLVMWTSSAWVSPYLSFKSDSETTANPDVTPPGCLFLEFHALCSSFFITSSSPATFLLAFLPSVLFLSKFRIALRQRGWLLQSHQNIPLCAPWNQLADLFVHSFLCVCVFLFISPCDAVCWDAAALLMQTTALLTVYFALCAIPQYLNFILPRL